MIYLTVSASGATAAGDIIPGPAESLMVFPPKPRRLGQRIAALLGLET
ncbi:hypothetical protein [Streptomyces sp. NPDC093544]